MNVVAIIQARMGSTRKPGKVMDEIMPGVPMIELTARRVAASNVNETVIATPSNLENRPLWDWVRSCFLHPRADEDDLINRFRITAEHFKADTIVRICADCPWVQPQIVDKLVAMLIDTQADYINDALGWYPIGIGLEAFTMDALAKAHERATDPYQREHIGPYFRQAGYDIKRAACSPESDFRNGDECPNLSVDYTHELEFAREIARRVDDPYTAHWREIREVALELKAVGRQHEPHGFITSTESGRNLCVSGVSEEWQESHWFDARTCGDAPFDSAMHGGEEQPKAVMEGFRDEQ